MHCYYARAAKTTDADTIYVVEASDEASAAHLVGHLGCVCITREQTLQAVEDSRNAKLETIAFRRGRRCREPIRRGTRRDGRRRARQSRLRAAILSVPAWEEPGREGQALTDLSDEQSSAVDEAEAPLPERALTTADIAAQFAAKVNAETATRDADEHRRCTAPPGAAVAAEPAGRQVLRSLKPAHGAQSKKLSSP